MSDDDDNAKPAMIRPPNLLKSKVGPPTPGGVDLKALERAEQIIANMADSYLDWVQDDLKRIQAAYQELTAAPTDKDRIEKVFEVAHDIKGQGGSFGFDLMTAIGHSLCRFLENRETLTGAELQVVRVHIETMKLVITNGMKGDGGVEGTRLLKGIDLIVAKVSK